MSHSLTQAQKIHGLLFCFRLLPLLSFRIVASAEVLPKLLQKDCSGLGISVFRSAYAYENWLHLTCSFALINLIKNFYALLLTTVFLFLFDDILFPVIQCGDLHSIEISILVFPKFPHSSCNWRTTYFIIPIAPIHSFSFFYFYFYLFNFFLVDWNSLYNILLSSMVYHICVLTTFLWLRNLLGLYHNPLLDETWSNDSYESRVNSWSGIRSYTWLILK